MNRPNVSELLFAGVGPTVFDQYVFCDELPVGDELPVPGTKRMADDGEHMTGVRKYWVDGWKIESQAGGPTLVGLRQAIHLGARAKFACSCGDDEIGVAIAETLKQQGFSEFVNVQHGRRSSSSIVWIDRNGRRSLLYDRGDLDEFEESQLRQLMATRPDVVHLDSATPNAAAVLGRLAQEAGVSVHFDLDPWTDRSPELLAFADIGQLSFRGAHEGIPHKGSIVEVARKLQTAYDLDLGIITDGIRGVYAVDRSGNEFAIPGYRVSSVDGVGAGDVFAGSFSIARLTGHNTADALRYAAAAGAIHTTRLGNAQLPSEEEILALMHQP